MSGWLDPRSPRPPGGLPPAHADGEVPAGDDGITVRRGRRMSSMKDAAHIGISNPKRNTVSRLPLFGAAWLLSPGHSPPRRSTLLVRTKLVTKVGSIGCVAPWGPVEMDPAGPGPFRAWCPRSCPVGGWEARYQGPFVLPPSPMRSCSLHEAGSAATCSRSTSRWPGPEADDCARPLRCAPCVSSSHAAAPTTKGDCHRPSSRRCAS